MASRSHPVEIIRVTVDAPARPPTRDLVAAEEPLEIRVSGETLAITLRTPGHDRELALGFLFAEGFIRSADEVSGLAHCGRPGDEGFGNTLEVTPAPGVSFDLDARAPTRRGTLITAACGVCGRRTIDDLMAVRDVVVVRERVSARVIAKCVRDLPEHQTLFRETGGCHGAGLFDFEGAHVATYEDVGRHNAVDKVVGAMLLRGGSVPLGAHLLVVSGRAGFEIVQKAHAAGIAVVASVSAPSSLAVDLARRAGVTLVGFAREETFGVYTGAERVTT